MLCSLATDVSVGDLIDSFIPEHKCPRERERERLGGMEEGSSMHRHIQEQPNNRSMQEILLSKQQPIVLIIVIYISNLLQSYFLERKSHKFHYTQF